MSSGSPLSAQSISSPSTSASSSLSSPIENETKANYEANSYGIENTKKLKVSTDMSKSSKKQRLGQSNESTKSTSKMSPISPTSEPKSNSSSTIASNISLGVTTLKRLYPNLKSSYIEKVLYSSDADLVVASQQLASEQHTKPSDSNINGMSHHGNLLSMANSQINVSSSSPMSSSMPASPLSSSNLLQEAPHLKNYHSSLMSFNGSNGYPKQNSSSPTYSHFSTQFQSQFSTQHPNYGSSPTSQQINNSPFHNKSSAFSPMLLNNQNNFMHHQPMGQEQAAAAAAAAAMQFKSNFAAAVASSPSHLSPFSAYRLPSGNHNGLGSNTGLTCSDIYNPFHQFPYFSFSSVAAQQLAAVAAVNNNKQNGYKMGQIFSPNNEIGQISYDQVFSQNNQNISSSSSSLSSSPTPMTKCKSPASLGSPSSNSATSLSHLSSSAPFKSSSVATSTSQSSLKLATSPESINPRDKSIYQSSF